MACKHGALLALAAGLSSLAQPRQAFNGAAVFAV